jgi:hypothetical protein
MGSSETQYKAVSELGSGLVVLSRKKEIFLIEVPGYRNRRQIPTTPITNILNLRGERKTIGFKRS